MCRLLGWYVRFIAATSCWVLRTDCTRRIAFFESGIQTVVMYVHNMYMNRKLVKNGNSSTLVITRDMKEHLGVDDAIEVEFVNGGIMLRRPVDWEEANRLTDERYGEAYEELAK